MSTKVKFYLNNTEVIPPLNWQGANFELNFDRDGNIKQSIDTTNWDFVRDNADLINAKVFDGITGGPGIFEAIPFDVKIQRGATIEHPYNGFIDLSKQASFSPDKCSVQTQQNQNIEWFDNANGFSFEYLRSIGAITPDDYDFMPYVINSVPDYKETAIAIITSYICITQIKESIQKLKELGADLGNPLTSISAIIKAALLLAYIVTLIIALVKVIKDIVTLIIQPVKYHACMSVKTLLEKGCAHMGLTLSSSVFTNSLFSKAYIMPEKYQNPVNLDDKRILGFTIPKKLEQEGFYKGTFGDLINALKGAFNAKVVIKDGVLHFERRDYNITPPQYILFQSNGSDIYNPVFETNADECKANYYIKFQTDSIEKNTFQEYEGTGYQVVLTPSVINNNSLVMLKGLEEISIPFALAKRKTELTIPEKIVKAFLDVLDAVINAMIAVVNAIISVINNLIGAVNQALKALKLVGINISFNVQPLTTISSVNLSNIIENRLNMMKLETDFTSIPKLFLMDKGSQAKFNKLTIGNETYLSGKYLYDNYHYINSFIPTADKPNANQYLRYNYQNVPFGFEQYLQVKNNNQIFANGKEAIIESVSWNAYNQKADIKIRISTLFTNNFVKTELIPNGK